MGKKKLVRVCKKCSGFDVKELGTILDDKQFSTGCIDKCLKKKSKLNGKIHGYIDGEFTVCETKEEFFALVKKAAEDAEKED